MAVLNHLRVVVAVSEVHASLSFVDVVHWEPALKRVVVDG